MKKAAGVSRADLLRCLIDHKTVGDGMAAIMNFAPVEVPQRPPDKDPNDSAPPTPGKPDTQPEPEAPEPLPEQPTLRFLLPERLEVLSTEPVQRPAVTPISDRETDVPWETPDPEIQPLVRWARLAPYVHQRLGTEIPSARLDLRQLLRQVSRGQPLLNLPRQTRRTWSADAVIVYEDSLEMAPFLADVLHLLKQLVRERGRHGLLGHRLQSPQDQQWIARLPPGAPVVALSAMGQLSGDQATQAAWISLAEKLRFRGHTIHVLVPCPRQLWEMAVAAAWPSAVWDRSPRLPRQGGLGALAGGRPERTDEQVEHLLDLLAPAARIEAPLLRETRLLLGSRLDVGDEYEAWHHPDCWSRIECFGLEAGEHHAARLNRRKQWPETKAMDAILERHQQTVSPLIAAETELRACLSSTPDAATVERIRTLFSRVAERLRELAQQPGSAAGWRSGLAPWFEGMVERLSPEMRQEPRMATVIAEGLAFAKVFADEASIRWPIGIDTEIAMAAMSQVTRPSAAPVDRPLRLQAGVLVLPGLPMSSPAGMPLGQLRAGTGHVHRKLGQGHSDHSLRLTKPETLSFPPLAQAETFTLQSDCQRLHVAAIEKPDWASRLGYDRFGLWAEFQIHDVNFRLRWIPPGQFLMGSPEDENGRDEDEGPQHEVTLSRGFWLGETPVTQAQWQSVATESLNPTPSHFEGPTTLPVENVNWHDSMAFCQALRTTLADRLPAGFQFTLPTEAQWEYACRSGTASAFNDGSACTVPEGEDPALKALGWFDKNSGQQTHAVGELAPNGFGLYDMHGNVWEWCLDDRLPYTEEVVTDPLGPTEGANRVARGGSWDVIAWGCRSAFRGQFLAEDRWQFLGLRLAAGQEPEPRSAEPTS